MTATFWWRTSWEDAKATQIAKETAVEARMLNGSDFSHSMAVEKDAHTCLWHNIEHYTMT